MGDIVGIADSAGNLISSYTYDAWGKVTSVTGNTTIGNINPFRYRSYYYDSDIEMYYLQSRYYDPDVGRFINCDDVNYLGMTESELSYNAFVYCENNPLNDIDANGYISAKTIINYIKSLGSQAWQLAKDLVSEFVWKKGHLGLKLIEILIDSLINFLPFKTAFKFVTYKAVTKNFVKTVFKNAKKGLSTFLMKMGFTIGYNKLFTSIVNSLFKYSYRLLTAGGIICLVIDNTDGKVDYWFNYGKFQT